MSEKKEAPCFSDLFEKLESMDSKICDVRKSLTKLKEYIIMETDSQEEEACLDEIEADQAAADAINEICLGILLESETKGEA